MDSYETPAPSRAVAVKVAAALRRQGYAGAQERRRSMYASGWTIHVPTLNLSAVAIQRLQSALGRLLDEAKPQRIKPGSSAYMQRAIRDIARGRMPRPEYTDD